MKNSAPIALFVYNRPNHTRMTIEALAANHGAAESDLFIFSDAPKSPAAGVEVSEVRAYIRTIKGFATVTLVERDLNIGLAQSIIDGVSKLTEEYGRVIVLEDDLVTAPFFLSFMNAGLATYEAVPGVLSICGYMYPVDLSNSAETFFLRAPHSWGWATWKDRWEIFNSNGHYLLNELMSRNKTRNLNVNGPHDYIRMLKDQIAGKNDSWFIRWYSWSLLNDRVSLYPARSLVSNIGIDGSGVHCAKWRLNPYAVELPEFSIPVFMQTPVESPIVKRRLSRYYLWIKLMRHVNFFYRMLGSIKNLLNPSHRQKAKGGA